ncbi:MAG TPA: FAD-binding oxidoreductase, partial [Longimicrobiales bacterium]|nr:FAD-binding oxidoreductase [Longimicrobiales bacterium]
MRAGSFPVAVGLNLPPLPPSFRGAILRSPGETAPWSGASGPFWRPPLGVLRPRDSEDVSVAVSWAAREGIPLIPRGGGTGMPGGNVGSGVILDLSDLHWIAPPGASGAPGAHGSGSGGPGTMTLRAGAGAVAAHLRDRAREVAMDLPALPSSARWCTLGGMLACNAAGARSFRHGAARSWVREVEWIRADGRAERITRGDPPAPEWRTLADNLSQALPDPLPWPRVRKNSSGYALDVFLPRGEPLALAVGSEGTLGVVTEAVLELTPPPHTRAVALMGVPTLPFLVEAAGAVAGIPAVEACEYFGRRLVELGGLGGETQLEDLSLVHGLLLLEVAGDAGEVEDALAALARLARGAGLVTARDPEGMAALWEFRHAASPTIARALSQGRRSTQFVEDSVVPVPLLGAYIEGLHEILARHQTDAVLFGHAGDG